MTTFWHDMWVPLGQLSDQAGFKERDNHPGLYGVGRLKPGRRATKVEPTISPRYE